MKTLSHYWTSGPADDMPLNPQHDRTILSLDIQTDKVVTSSADHGVRVYSLKSGKCTRNLYNKRYGHTDWVTSVKFLNDQRILSAGMDNKLCLWDARVVKCSELQGHNSTISKIMVDNQNIGISSSYDSSLLVWNLDTLECAQGLFNAHKDAIVEFQWRNSLVVSGDRGGSMALWDINTGKAVSQMKNVHSGGAVHKINFFSDGQNSDLIMSAGLKDGALAIHDMRSHKLVKKTQIHGGAINFLDSSMSGFIVTASADKTIKTFDIYSGFKPLSVMSTTDAVFCGELLQNLILVGCGDGNIVCYNLDNNDCLYGYGADSKGAVHCMQINDDKDCLVTGGDSGQGLCINFC